MIDKISDNEFKMMKQWRDWYASDDDYGPCKESAPIKDILSKVWAKEKQTLYKLLGNNLIISKEFSYQRSRVELEKQIREEMLSGYGGYGFGRVNRQCYKFIDNLNAMIETVFPVVNPEWDFEKHCYMDLPPEVEKRNDQNIEIRNGIFNLVNYITLANNEFTGTQFTIPLKNGKRYVVSRGCKPMRALSKIAEAYEIEDFEDFRICHSQIHNQKKIKGTITLSIHPLDYWTMSDNECGWESCMSWRENGCYRLGTVEMMNSPCVVVAYIESDDPMEIMDDLYWTNKKWRQLFIVDKDVILGIKQYPYENEALSNYVMKWLKELAETNMGWTYTTDEVIQYKPSYTFKNPKGFEVEKFTMEFVSCNMYTDVGRANYHPMFCGTELSSEKEQKIFNYSGLAQCVNCGETNVDFDNESELYCNDCIITTRCCECGERIADPYYLDSSPFCEDCYRDFAEYCSFCGDAHLREGLREIEFLLRLDDESKQKLIIAAPDGPQINGYRYVARLNFPPVALCNYCYNNFIKSCIKEDRGNAAIVPMKRSFWEHFECVYIDDLNDEGIELLPPEIRSIFSELIETPAYEIIKKYPQHFHVELLKPID